MATRPARVISSIAAGLVVAFFAFLGLKNSIILPWQPPADFQIYMVTGDDGRNLFYDFTTDGDGILWYHNTKTKYTEGVLFHIARYQGAHYFWRFWNISESGGPLGFRFYPEGMTPYVLNYTIRSKYVEGSDDPSLPEKGVHISRSVILKSSEGVQFDDMRLERFDTQKTTGMDGLAFTARLMGYFGDPDQTKPDDAQQK